MSKEQFDFQDPTVRDVATLTDAQLRARGVSDDDIRSLREAQWSAEPDNLTPEQREAARAATVLPLQDAVAGIFRVEKQKEA